MNDILNMKNTINKSSKALNAIMDELELDNSHHVEL